MAYPADVLVADEQVLLHRHPHWSVLVRPVVLLLAVAAVLGFTAAAVRGLDARAVLWALLAAAGGVVVARGVLWPALRWRATHLVVTDRRVLVREGVLGRAGVAVPVDHVTGVRYRATPAARLLGTGTLVVEVADADALELDRVPRVARAHALLHERTVGAADPPGRGRGRRGRSPRTLPP